jgi:two-component system response regulator YesN
MYHYIVVDDESIIRKGTIKKLEPIQNEAQCIGEASNGKEALELIQLKNPDIVITDMNMPILDGIDLLSELTKSYPEIRIIVISGFKDFTYMKQAITASAVDYILKPFSKTEIQRSVLAAIHQLEDNISLQNKITTNESEAEAAKYTYYIQMLKNLILGYHSELEEITSKRLKFINDRHNLIVITIHSTKGINNKVIENFINVNGFGDLALYLQHVQNNYIGMIVLFLSEQGTVKPLSLCQQIINSITTLFDSNLNNLSFGISATHSDLKNLHEAYLETIYALNTKKIGDNSNYFIFQQKKDELSTPFQWNKSEELLFRIEAGMTDVIEPLLNDLFSLFESNSDLTYGDVKYYCFKLSDQVKFIMKQYYEQIQPTSVSSSMQNVLNSMFSLSEIKSYYLQFYQNLSKSLKDKSIYSTDDTIEKIKIYVQRNYKNDLSIEFISSLFYLNRSYCSHIFKEKTGQNFVDYMNSVRIDHAKKLLKSTDKKMYQISKLVGYDNVKYFFRIFKKSTGMTPEQYRNQI